MEVLLKSRKFEVVRKPVTGRDGSAHTHDVVVHPGAVVILPLLGDGRCVMLRQFRPALDRELWELPAGTLDIPGEPPETAAARELEEETGYQPGTLTFLGEFFPSPGILTERIRAYIATDLKKTAQNLGVTERIEVVPMKLSDALTMIDDGEILDGKTIFTLLMHARANGGAT